MSSQKFARMTSFSGVGMGLNNLSRLSSAKTRSISPEKPTGEKGGSVFATVPTAWQIVNTGDSNGDGHPDIVRHNSQTGQVAVWLMGGTTRTTILSKNGPFMTIANLSRHIASTGDMDGDGHPDLTWHTSTTGQTIVWLMGGANGTTQLSAGAPLAASPKTTWSIVGVR
jgi:hypothetical protein